jgi:hypothetical protein
MSFGGYLSIGEEDLHRCGLFDLIVGAYDDYGRPSMGRSPATAHTDSRPPLQARALSKPCAPLWGTPLLFPALNPLIYA